MLFSVHRFTGCLGGAIVVLLSGCILDVAGTGGLLHRQPDQAELPREPEQLEPVEQPPQPPEQPEQPEQPEPPEQPEQPDPPEPPEEEPPEEEPPEEEPVALCAPSESLIACLAFEGNPDDGSAHAFTPEVARDLGYAPGKQGQALLLTRGSSLRFPHDAAWAVPEMTIDVWINPASLPEHHRFTVIDSDGKPSLFLMPGGVIRCTMGIERNVPHPIVPGEWTHIACLSDGHTQSLYVNGVQIDQSTSGPVLATEAQPIHIGSEQPSGQDEFNGLIDSLRVWSRTLAPEEICAAAGKDGC
jgi:hypothetical protein